MSRNPPHVSLIVPTQRRLEGLVTAVRSLFRQTGVSAGALELVVVDNDPAASARDTVAGLAAEAPFPVAYVHEPSPGVANARNSALAKAQAPLIAFLDDDEEAGEGWLAALLAVQADCGADVVFGPVRGRAPASVVRHRSYLERFFSREGPEAAGPIDHYYGCGNSLLRRAALPDPDRPFAADRNFIGGEDDLLFAQMQARGARFAWAPEAWVWEDPVPSRLSLRYAIVRAFGYGQGPSAACAAAEPRDWLGMVGWMGQGVVQAAVFGLVAGGKWLMRSPDYAFALDRAARGLGKTLWFGPFKLKYYGLPART
ncbi:MAG: glycosyltransferase family 2 protein [Phenylobacterium sp.]|uniref:glycosyltransferase family 2 protein n=1 Tax=Phenylobacterium sp. TaxID=1871053 RepID=UPI00391B1A30